MNAAQRGVEASGSFTGYPATGLRTQGITCTTYAASGHSAAGDVELTFPLDLVPRIIAAWDWAEMADGLAQRVHAPNAFLAERHVTVAVGQVRGANPLATVPSQQSQQQ